MGLLSTLGTIGGSLLGGPVGGAIGGALGGAIEGSDTANAAQAAAGQTAAATNQATALQREMWQAQQAQQQPWLQSGIAAQNRLLTLLGINPATATATAQTGGGGNGVADMVANAIRQTMAPGASPYSLTVDTTSPDFGKYGKAFSETNWQADPGYAFRLSEGMKALDRQAAARGGLISGSALKAAQRYGQDMGSQEYQNAYNRYYNERSQMLNPLQSLAGVGQTSSNTLGTAGQNYAANVGNALINQGYAAGNAGIAAANARQSMYGNIGSALGQVTPSQWSNLSSTLGNYFGNPLTALNYGTNLGSQQTNMLAAQEAGMY